MTYNPDEWEPGDLAWITTNEEDPRIRNKPHHHGRRLMWLVRRRVPGQVTGTDERINRWLEGSLHWIDDVGAWIKADARPGMILDAERALALTVEEAAERNDRERPMVVGTRMEVVRVGMPDGSTRNIPFPIGTIDWRLDHA